MVTSLNWLFLQLFTIFLLPALSFIHINLNDFHGSPLMEKERIHDIDFQFSKLEGDIVLMGTFHLDRDMDCIKSTAFSFDHKKLYTKGSAKLELERQGDNWYEVHYLIDKFYMARANALYHYSLDDHNNRINFYLKSNEVNIKTFDLLLSSKGSIHFSPSEQGIELRYELFHKMRSSIFQNSLYEIQKKETIRLMKDLKEYLTENCI